MRRCGRLLPAFSIRAQQLEVLVDRQVCRSAIFRYRPEQLRSYELQLQARRRRPPGYGSTWSGVSHRRYSFGPRRSAIVSGKDNRARQRERRRFITVNGWIPTARQYCGRTASPTSTSSRLRAAVLATVNLALLLLRLRPLCKASAAGRFPCLTDFRPNGMSGMKIESPRAAMHSQPCDLSRVELAGLGEAAVFLSPKPEYDPKLILQSPPADGTPAAKAELAELDRIAAARTADEFAAAKSDDETENATIFESTIGRGFAFAKFPATAKLMADVMRNDEKAAATSGEESLQAQPALDRRAGSLETCGPRARSTGNPPIRAVTPPWVIRWRSCSVGAAMPDKAQAILARANGYAENRLVCGMHFRRDIVAGEVLGTAVGAQRCFTMRSSRLNSTQPSRNSRPCT